MRAILRKLKRAWPFLLMVVCGSALGQPLPLVEGFEGYATGTNPGWRLGFPSIGTGEGSVAVTDTDASSNGGGAKSLRWQEPAGGQRGGVSNLWDAPASSGTATLNVRYDFKIVQHTDRGLSFVVSGWSGDTLTLNVYNVRFDVDTDDGLPVGWSYLDNGVWNNFLPVADPADVVGHWFNYDASIDVGARTVDLTISRLDGQLSGHILGSFQTEPGVNPLDEDIANYRGINIGQANPAAASEVLIDNIDVEVSGGPPVPPVNDDCANAITVTDGVTGGTTRDGTNDGSASCGNSNTSPDVWYKYVALCGDEIHVNTCSANFDTVLSVHTGCPGTAANEVASGCNNDCGGSPCGGSQSCLIVPVQFGTTYWIRVAGNGGQEGTFALNIACRSPLPALPLDQDFESDPVGSTGGAEQGYPTIGDGEGPVEVIDTDASPSAGGSRSLRWAEPAGGGRGALIRRWQAPASNGSDILHVNYDFKIVQQSSNALGFIVSGWNEAGTVNLNVYNVRFDSDTTEGLEVGWNYLSDGVWTSFLPVADPNDVVGHWFNYDARINLLSRTVELAIQRLDGGLSGNTVGGFQTALGVNPLDEDLANYEGIDILQSSPAADSELVLDNLLVEVIPQVVGPPVNDNCANAVIVTNGATVGRTIGATSDGSASCGSSNGSPDVWYTYTATCTGETTVSTCGTSFDTVLSIHAGCPGTSANEVASGCNDDCSGAPCGGPASCATIVTQTGQVYWIRVAGNGGATGHFALNITCAPFLENDTCEAAQVVTDGSYAGSTLLASNDGDASCGASGLSPDAWYSYTAAADGELLVDTCGSGFDTVLSAHSGCPGQLDNELGCNNDCGAAQSCLVIPVVASQTVLIRVAGADGATGDFTLNVANGPASSRPQVPFDQDFEGEPVGSKAGWEVGFPSLTPAVCGTQLDVIDTDASPRLGGSKSLHWIEPAGAPRSGYGRRWAPLPSSTTATLHVSYDFKILQHTTKGLSFVVSGWDESNQLNLNVYSVRFDVDTTDGLEIGWNLYDGAWTNFLPIADPADVIGHWFNYDATVDLTARTVDLTISRLDNQLSGHILGGFQGGNPLDADLANYQGVYIFQANPAATSEVLIDNVHVAVEGAGGCNNPFADADGDGDVDQVDFAGFQRCFTGVGGGVSEACACFDRDDDGDVDTTDFLDFAACGSGPTVPADPACDN